MPIQDLFTRAQWGKNYGPTKGTWYRVPFEVLFAEEPSVVIIGVARTGRLITRVIDKVSTTKIPAFEIPRIGIGTPDEVGRTIGDAYWNEGAKRLGDWGLFNWIRDGILGVAWGLGYITGIWIHWMYTILVQPQIDKVRDAVNTAISGQVDRINSALSSQVDRVIERANAVLVDLYDSWGLPSGVIATPVHVRRVSTGGFEWQSYGGTTIYWIAVGRTRTKLFELPELIR